MESSGSAVVLICAPADAARIEPLRQALTSAGVETSALSVDLGPGDSITEALQAALQSAAIAVVGVTANLAGAPYAQAALNAVLALAIEAGRYRVIPLLLDDSEELRVQMPLLADLCFLRWQPSRAAEVAGLIAEMLGSPSLEVWMSRARKARGDGELVRSAIYARFAVGLEPRSYDALLLYLRALLDQGATRELHGYLAGRWMELAALDTSTADVDLLDAVQDGLTSCFTLEDYADERDGSDLARAVVSVVRSRHNGERAWRYYARLFDKPWFSSHREDLVGAITFYGREHAARWLLATAAEDWEESTATALAGALYALALRVPDAAAAAVATAERLLSSRFERARSMALTAAYYGSPRGADFAVAHLHDRAPTVRMTAFDLLSGNHRRTITADWGIEDGPARPPDPRLDDVELGLLLNDPDPFVREQVIAGIRERPDYSAHLADAMRRPPSSFELRLAKVARLRRREGADTAEQLLDLAARDPSELVRCDAVRALAERSDPIEGAPLRSLYEGETLYDAWREIAGLLADKGDAALDDLLVDVIKRCPADRFLVDRALRALASHGNPRWLAEAFETVLRRSAFELPWGFDDLLRLRSVEPILATLVPACLQDASISPLALLAVAQVVPLAPRDVDRLLTVGSADQKLAARRLSAAVARADGTH